MDPMTAADFSEMAADFCSRHSFENPPLAPNLHATSFGSNPSASRPGKRSVNEMTEEEQLEAAIQASRNEMEDDDSHMQAKDEGQSQGSISINTIEDIKNSSSDLNLKSPESSWEAEIAGMDVGEEPTVPDGVAKIMFRLPDGKRLVRKFYLTDSVKKVYSYVAVRFLIIIFHLSINVNNSCFALFKSNPSMMPLKENRLNSRLAFLPRICFRSSMILLRTPVYQVIQ